MLQALPAIEWHLLALAIPEGTICFNLHLSRPVTMLSDGYCDVVNV